MKQRNHAFDLLCGICIVRMILLHISGYCGVSTHPVWVEVMHWSFYFMSFFFFKAGYFNKTIDGNSWEFCKKKFKQLMIPYYVWGAIGSIIYFTFIIFFLPSNNVLVTKLSWSDLWTTSGFHGNNPCWFLFSFFVAYIAMHFIERVKRLHWIVLIFPFVSYWLYTQGNPLYLYLNNVFWGIFLFFLGRVWRIVIERLRPPKMITISLVMLALFCVLNYIDRSEYTMSSNAWNGNFLICFPKIMLSICGLSGLLLSVHVPRIPVFNYIGQHSMVYFVSHFPMLTFYHMVRMSFVRTIRGHWDDWIILVVLIFVFCTWIVPYVERVPWLSGRFPKKPATPKATAATTTATNKTQQ